MPSNTVEGRRDLRGFENLVTQEGRNVDDRLRGELGFIQGFADRTGEDQALARADDLSVRSADNDAAQFERATRGMDLSDRQKRSAGRRQSLSRSLNRARAAGFTRRGFTDRSKAAASAGGSFADALFGQRLSGETSQASIFAEQEAKRLGRNADKKTARFATVGQVAGMAAMAFFSSEDLKHDRGHEAGLLKRLKNVRVNRWQYKGDSKTHVGPFSEEFNREFGIKTDRPDMINVIDALGVTMGAIKELDKKVEARG